MILEKLNGHSIDKCQNTAVILTVWKVLKQTKFPNHYSIKYEVSSTSLHSMCASLCYIHVLLSNSMKNKLEINLETSLYIVSGC